MRDKNLELYASISQGIRHQNSNQCILLYLFDICLCSQLIHLSKLLIPSYICQVQYSQLHHTLMWTGRKWVFVLPAFKTRRMACNILCFTVHSIILLENSKGDKIIQQHDPQSCVDKWRHIPWSRPSIRTSTIKVKYVTTSRLVPHHVYCLKWQEYDAC